MWNPISTRDTKRAVNEFEGGINVGTPSFDLQDGESTDEVGWDSNNLPSLQTRKGRSSYGGSGGAVHRLLTNFKESQLVRAVGPTLQYFNTNWINIATLTDTDWDATNFEANSNPALILTNGMDNVKVWDGTTLTDLNATNAPKGKYITNDTVRVWIAKGDILYFSAFLNASDWTTQSNSGSVEYFTPNGGDITGIKNFNNHICVFKKESFAEIFGTDYYNFRMIENSNNIGCLNYKTIQEVGDSLFWLGTTDVYQYRGGRPVRIGQKIRKYLDSINWTYIDKCYGAQDGLKYYLGLVTGTNTEPDTMLMYDPRYDVWRVSSLNDNYRYAAFFQGNWYIGDASGQMYLMNQNNVPGIPFSWTSKPFHDGAPELAKEWIELHLQAYIPAGSNLTLAVSTTDRGDNFTDIYTATNDVNVENMDIIVPLDSIPISNWFRYKLYGSGYVEVNSLARYYRVQPEQI